jgi:polysaccharide deacetylase family protein (PEP-CTERM system associated)
MIANETQVNFLTIDVEDYYQVSAFESLVGHSRWDDYPSRVISNTNKILELLQEHGVSATFFVLGWTARKFPKLVQRIQEMGHEVACHSLHHRLIYTMTSAEFREDTRIAKDILEQITGRNIRGYRAPSYSITRDSLWAFDILEELEFAYDSSIFPIHHDRYGIPNAPRFPHRLEGRNLMEFPLSTAKLCGLTIPVAGGGYFRLFPYHITKMALHGINHVESKPFIFYLHPWELDPAQPRMEGVRLLSRSRHYLNLSRTTARFARLLKDFRFQPLGLP